MKITRQIAADKLADYLHGKLSQADLVNWAEHAMMDAEFDDADTEVFADLIGRLGLADVAEFGLRWQAVAGATYTEGGAEAERTRLGSPGNRDLGSQSRTARNFFGGSAIARRSPFQPNERLR